MKASDTLTADQPKGQELTAVFRAQLNKAKLTQERGQILVGNKAFAAGLQELIQRSSLLVQAPKGGRIQIVCVPVNLGREWREAVKAAGPDTGKNWDIWKVGDHYPSQPGETADEEIILVNFGKTIPSTKSALDWAKPLGLRPKTPRSVFAVGEHKPQLHRELGVSGIAIISPVPCSFGGESRVCDVWCGDSGRGADLNWFDDDWRDGCWFAFGRE